MSVPKVIRYTILLVIVVAMIPPALIAQLRAVNSKSPRVHLILDMDNQPKFRAQHASRSRTRWPAAGSRRMITTTSGSAATRGQPTSRHR